MQEPTNERIAQQLELQQVEKQLRDLEMDMMLGVIGGDVDAITRLRERREQLRQYLGLG